MASKPMKEHMIARESSYPMISIGKAINTILNEVEEPTQICYARLNECGNRISAKDIFASIDLPNVNTSIMDGYAMNFALNNNEESVGSQLGIYKVVNIVTAGNECIAPKELEKGEVVYVTTGSALPSGTDCVIRVEDTEIIDENTIKILHSPIAALQSVRTKGSDIKKGQLLLNKGTKLQSSELGILASCGIIMIPVYSKIRVTILSTGDELKDPFTFNMDNDDNNIDNKEDDDDDTKNLIFDSNKIMLMELINESLRNLCIIKDGGMIGDDRDKLKKHIVSLLSETDILITTGGVSMGSRDYIKPILNEIGDIKIGRVSIKPGKPTTFATVMVSDKDNDNTMSKKLVFGLPGNPVSSNVCFKMFVDPAIRKYTGILKNFNCQHPPISVEITKNIKMDPERPNYNRCVIYWDKAKNRFIGYDTGSQRSSRLLSCKSANCLLRVPQKDGILEKGSIVKGLVIGPLTPEMPPEIDDDDKKDGDDLEDKHEHLMDCMCGKSHHGQSHGDKHNERTLNININIGVLTVSDRASKGIYKDESGPVLVDGLKKVFGDKYIDKMDNNIVADESDEIAKYLKEWDEKCHLIITIGGTGFGQRDITPEITKKFIEKDCPGIVYKMLEYGSKKTEFACLARYNAGITKNNTLIINMPGSIKAVKQCLDSIKVILPHAINQINEKPK